MKKSKIKEPKGKKKPIIVSYSIRRSALKPPDTWFEFRDLEPLHK